MIKTAATSHVWLGWGKGEHNMPELSGAKVFSATKAREREELGTVVTKWIREHTEVEIIDKIITQSSDREFHCLTLTVFYQTKKQ